MDYLVECDIWNTTPTYDGMWYSFFFSFFFSCYLHKTKKHDSIKGFQNIYYKNYAFVHRKYRQQFYFSLYKLRQHSPLNILGVKNLFQNIGNGLDTEIQKAFLIQDLDTQPETTGTVTCLDKQIVSLNSSFISLLLVKSHSTELSW